MRKRIFWPILIGIALFVLYFLTWPVEVEPVAWQAPVNPGYTGAFTKNERLKGLEMMDIGDVHGPEDIALDSQGCIYAATHEGLIIRLQADGTNPEKWANTNGRPLGIDFDNEGSLIVADAYRGLLSIDPTGQVKELATEADGVAIRYADDVDVANDGKIYFSDASSKFGAKEYGGTYAASLLDINEHGGHGRLLAYDPQTGETTTLLDGLNFANGVAVGHDQSYILVNETGGYRIIRYWISGPNLGKSEPFMEALPSFPDNISTGLNGRYWVALVSPRNFAIDKFSNSPFIRKMIQRLPAFMHPAAVPYGHVIAVDENANVIEDLQDPHTQYPTNTSVTETIDYLYIGSLFAPSMARLPKTKAGL